MPKQKKPSAARQSLANIMKPDKSADAKMTPAMMKKELAKGKGKKK